LETEHAPEEKDLWRQLHQELPKIIYDRLMEQMKRLALANGISAESFIADSKFKQAVGPRVQAWECLMLLMERTESDDTFRV